MNSYVYYYIIILDFLIFYKSDIESDTLICIYQNSYQLFIHFIFLSFYQFLINYYHTCKI